MRNPKLLAWVPATILLGGALLLWSVREQRSVALEGDLQSVLADVDGYRIEDQVVSDEERRVAGMTDYVARLYWSDSTTIAFTTYVGYYDRQTQGKTIHSPRNCLPGAGWEILRTGTATIVALGGEQVVNRYVLKNGRQEAVVYYWYQGRGRIAHNEYAVKLDLLRDAALVGHTEEALVRIVVPVASGSDYIAADDLGYRIAARLLTEVEDVLPDSDGSPRPLVATLTERD